MAHSGKKRSKILRTAWLAAMAAGLLAAGPALAGEPCGSSYPAELASIRNGTFKTLEALDIRAELGRAARLESVSAGGLAMPTPAGNAGAEVGRARRLAAQLAMSGGSRSLPATAANRWVAERVRTDLADYLGQKPTPYLCAGLTNYLGTLRAEAGRLAVSDSRLDAAIATLTQVVEEEMAATLAALRPVPAPRFAPQDRPGTLLAGPRSLPDIDGQVMEEQGDAGMLTRVAYRPSETMNDATVFAPQPDTIHLDSRAAVERAARRLVFAARRGHVLSMPRSVAAAMPGWGASHYISIVAPSLAGPQAGLTDPLAAPALRAALADIEALDVLLAARDGGMDPVASALEETMSSIEAAHARACACAR